MAANEFEDDISEYYDEPTGFNREFVGTISLPSGWLTLRDSQSCGEVDFEIQDQICLHSGGGADFQAQFQNIRVPIYVTRENNEIVSIELNFKGMPQND